MIRHRHSDARRTRRQSSITHPKSNLMKCNKESRIHPPHYCYYHCELHRKSIAILFIGIETSCSEFFAEDLHPNFSVFQYWHFLYRGFKSLNTLTTADKFNQLNVGSFNIKSLKKRRYHHDALPPI